MRQANDKFVSNEFEQPKIAFSQGTRMCLIYPDELGFRK